MRNSAIEKTEKSLAEILFMVLLVALLMAIFIYYFFKSEEAFTSSSFGSIKSSFASKVTVVHAQWLMDNQPEAVLTKSVLGTSSISEKILVPVNKKGWITSNDNAFYCDDIWLIVMETPIAMMSLPISAIEIRQKSAQARHYCRFSIASGEYFDYYPENGRVTGLLK